jgi:hypothetical protein
MELRIHFSIYLYGMVLNYALETIFLFIPKRRIYRHYLPNLDVFIHIGSSPMRVQHFNQC